MSRTAAALAIAAGLALPTLGLADAAHAQDDAQNDARNDAQNDADLLRGPDLFDTADVNTDPDTTPDADPEDDAGFGFMMGPPERPDRRRGRPARALTPFRATFDADGDGSLNDDEAAALDEALPAYHELLLAPYDLDTNGRIDREEFSQALELLGLPDPADLRRGRARDGDNARDGGDDGRQRRRRGARDRDVSASIDAPAEGAPAYAVTNAALQPEADDRPGRPGPGARDPEQIRQAVTDRLLARFDSNGNGRIDPEEQDAVDQAISDRHVMMLERLDANADAVIDEAEVERAKQRLAQRADRGDRGRADRPGGQAPGDRRARLIERFDADGDGVLSDEERAAARRALERRRESR